MKSKHLYALNMFCKIQNFNSSFLFSDNREIRKDFGKGG